MRVGITNFEELRWRAEENLREAFRLMARHAADGAVLEVDNACLVATGVPNAFFNPVFLYRAPDDLENFLKRIRAFFEARGGLPWTLVVLHHEEALPVLSSDRLRDTGMLPAGNVPMLVRGTQRDTAWSRFHTNVTIQQVDDFDSLADYREVLTDAFSLPAYAADMLLSEPPPPTMHLYVAYSNGDPVGTASLFEAAGVGGIYNLGTLPTHRGTGVATALVRHILDDACWECGLTECVAQVPRAGLSLFRSLGFDRVGICARYVEPQHLPPDEGKRRAG